MGEKIEDGTGGGYSAKVDEENRLWTFSITEPEDKHLNREGSAWIIHGSVTPAGANDYFFYLENTGSATLFIEEVDLASTVASDIYIKKVTGTPSYTSDTDLTPVPLNLGTSKSITATIKSDTDTTGLTDGGTLGWIKLAAADTEYFYKSTAGLVIPQGSALALQREAATGTVEFAITIIDLTEG